MVNERAVSRNAQVILQEWADFCLEHSALHHIAWLKTRRLNILTTVPAILLSAASGISTIAFSGQPCDHDPVTRVVFILLGIATLSGTTLIALNKFMNYMSLSDQHAIYSSLYLLTYNDILMNIAIDNTASSVYKNKVEFLKHCKSKIDSYLEREPPISDSVVKSLQRLGGAARKRDDSLKTSLFTRDDVLDAFTWLVIDAYRDGSVTPCDSVMEDTLGYREDVGDDLVMMSKMFEVTHNQEDFVLMKDLDNMLRKNPINHRRASVQHPHHGGQGLRRELRHENTTRGQFTH
ncbi:hypothetical protein CEUSTIGMA_g13135.t1 [Chlamydomonas eustigma]|uniref:SMODS and SLOG-associating 2TM effector domain-containing protein n=1 Tax=Chlamydomonas eustigma TaxID=1157962 RepID=A0A250XSE4_9CHLO|nr:hypothetical protein CEUSTIGMA_g13135.t1 [Chlamydomonas eustigma]|eukprot:GAX85720.1 hypothetical protein CEUSTIGMA_g13135.t1 [Chlamydomonas eustigma]